MIRGMTSPIISALPSRSLTQSPKRICQPNTRAIKHQSLTYILLDSVVPSASSDSSLIHNVCHRCYSTRSPFVEGTCGFVEWYPAQLTLSPQDLGKSASDLLLKDYPIHGTSLEVKTSSYPTTFKVAGTRDAKSAAIAGDIEGKYVDFKNGITFTQAWTTTNLLRTQVELENQIAKGLKLDLATTLNPAKAQKSAIVTAIYKQPSLHTRATVDMFKGPTFTSDVVLGRDGALVGAEATYDVLAGAITRYAGAIGYSAPVSYACTSCSNTY